MNFRNFTNIGIAAFLFFSISCKGENAAELKSVPYLTTVTVSEITQFTASIESIITADGGAAIIARGVCWSTNTLPTIADNKTTDGTGTGNFTSKITGLLSATKYFVRAYAVNSTGTGYGNEILFTTLAASEITVTDIDGNVYKTVKIGNQVWMAENLKTTKLNDGEPIPNVSSMTEWGNLTTPGFCWGNNNPTNKDAFGGLYNWHAVNSGKLAPKGWHIPTIAEWETLIELLGGKSIAGGKMKTTSKWFQPNSGGTNESGFSAVPVNYRNYDGYVFWNPGDYASFWSATEVNALYALGTRLTADSRECKIYESGVKKTYGYSIRCIKN